jgi:hypothetical protein
MFSFHHITDVADSFFTLAFPVYSFRLCKLTTCTNPALARVFFLCIRNELFTLLIQTTAGKRVVLLSESKRLFCRRFDSSELTMYLLFRTAECKRCEEKIRDLEIQQNVQSKELEATKLRHISVSGKNSVFIRGVHRIGLEVHNPTIGIF